MLESALLNKNKAKSGRPPFDKILMFNIIILQRYFNISDDQTEFQIKDRLSFMDFLNLELSDKIPDAKTIWFFKDQPQKIRKKTMLVNLKSEVELNMYLVLWQTQWMMLYTWDKLDSRELLQQLVLLIWPTTYSGLNNW